MKAKRWRLGVAFTLVVLSAAILAPAESRETTIDAGNLPGAPPLSLEGGWQSTIKVQNLSDRPGTVIIEFRDAAGKVAGEGVTRGIAASGSVELRLNDLPQQAVPPGRYGAVISSDVPVAALATQANSSQGMADSYLASWASKAFDFPYIFRGHNDWYTTLFIQNTVQEAALYDFRVEGVSVRGSISGGGNATIDLASAAFQALGNGFKGAGVLEASQEVAVVVVQSRVAGSSRVMTSSAAVPASDASAVVALPSLYKGVNGWRSSIQIRNPSATQRVSLTLMLRPDQGTIPGGPWVRSGIRIAPGETYEFDLGSDNLLVNDFRGSGMISSTGPVQAAVIHTNYDRAVAAGYVGLPVFRATSRVSLPVLYKSSDLSDWRSGIKLQNLTSDDVVVSVTFRGDEGVLGGPWRKTGVSLRPFASQELYLAGLSLDGGTGLPDGFKGSAVVEAIDTKARVAATALHTNYSQGVAVMYNGLGY